MGQILVVASGETGMEKPAWPKVNLGFLLLLATIRKRKTNRASIVEKQIKQQLGPGFGLAHSWPL